MSKRVRSLLGGPARAATPAAAVLPDTVFADAPGCQATPDVLAQTALSDLSDLWFGSTDCRFAVVLATNLRVADRQFGFIAGRRPLRFRSGHAWGRDHIA